MDVENDQGVKFWVQIRLTTDDKPFEAINSTDSFIETKKFAEMLTNSKQEGYGLLSVHLGDEIQIEAKKYKIDNVEVLIGNYPDSGGVSFHTFISVTEI